MDSGNNLYKGIIHKLYQIAQEDGGRAKRLPTLRVLAEQFGCTHPTVLRAVRELLETGLLIQLKGGGYMTVPQDSVGNFRNLAVIFGNGMNLTDAGYSIQIKYHALYELVTRVWGLNFSEIHAETCGELGRILRTGAYAGAVLCSPDPQIIPDVTAACRDIGIPVGVFAGCSGEAGDVSVTYDMKNNFLQVFLQLLRRKRHRVLAVSCPGNPWNPEMEKAIDAFSGKFEKSLFVVDRSAAVLEYILGNTGGRGEDFDAVVYVMHIHGSYEKLSDRAPDCLCVIPEFAIPFVKDFHGLVMGFDLESAGREFARAMLSVLNQETPESPRSFIPCSLEEIR